MKTRIDLQNELEKILGSKNVYYQPPESIKMNYPAIRYSKNDSISNYADDIKYKKHTSYEIIVISKLPDNPVIDKILDLPYTDYTNHYTSDNLNHDVITIYI